MTKTAPFQNPEVLKKSLYSQATEENSIDLQTAEREKLLEQERIKWLEQFFKSLFSLIISGSPTTETEKTEEDKEVKEIAKLVVMGAELALDAYSDLSPEGVAIRLVTEIVQTAAENPEILEEAIEAVTEAGKTLSTKIEEIGKEVVESTKTLEISEELKSGAENLVGLIFEGLTEVAKQIIPSPQPEIEQQSVKEEIKRAVEKSELSLEEKSPFEKDKFGKPQWLWNSQAQEVFLGSKNNKDYLKLVEEFFKEFGTHDAAVTQVFKSTSAKDPELLKEVFELALKEHNKDGSPYAKSTKHELIAKAILGASKTRDEGGTIESTIKALKKVPELNKELQENPEKIKDQLKNYRLTSGEDLNKLISELTENEAKLQKPSPSPESPQLVGKISQLETKQNNANDTEEDTFESIAKNMSQYINKNYEQESQKKDTKKFQNLVLANSNGGFGHSH